MPEDQRQLEAAWQALTERERRGEEAMRQRAAELEERSARSGVTARCAAAYE